MSTPLIHVAMPSNDYTYCERRCHWEGRVIDDDAKRHGEPIVEWKRWKQGTCIDCIKGFQAALRAHLQDLEEAEHGPFE